MAEKKAPDKIKVTNELRKNWLMLKKAWLMNLSAFSNQLSLVPDKQAEQLYDVVRHSVYKDSYVDILREHPELKELVKNDDDRFFMHDMYESLSWRLGKREKPPKERQVYERMKGGIGREAPSY